MSGFEGEYTWVVIFGGFVGFICAFGIGANDFANSFGSSVATKALTMWQCVIVAVVCEFSGAIFLGAGVTDTIQSGIAKVDIFQQTPDLLLWGMFSVMIAGAFWNNLACHLGLPVSTTHTTVSAIIGMSLVTYGSNAVVWYRWCSASNNYCGAGSKEKQKFPVKGIIPIVLSWIVSPIASGIMVSIFYGFLRSFVLRSSHSFFRGLMLLPWAIGFTFGLISAFVIQIGVDNGAWKERSDGEVGWIASVVGCSSVILTYCTIVPILRRKVLEDEELMEREASNEKGLEGANGGYGYETEEERATRIASLIADINATNRDPIGAKVGAWMTEWKRTRVGNALLNNPVAKFIAHGSTYDIHGHGMMADDVIEIWKNAEVFDLRTERLFRYLQIISAMVMSFAHGSNDVANAMGPFATVYYIYKHGTVPKKSPVPEWILVLGGCGIVWGLAIYGYHIIQVIGVKAVKLTNARGFCAELSTALVIVIASRFGLPVSTTQTIVGAVFALGLFEGFEGANWKLLNNIFYGWILTLVVAGFVGAIFQAFGIFSPHKQATVEIVHVIFNNFNPDITNIIQQLNSTTNSTSQMFYDLLKYNTSLTDYSKAPYNFTGLAELQSDILDVYNATLCSA